MNPVKVRLVAVEAVGPGAAPGVEGARFVEDVSRLIGDHDVAVRSVSRGSGRASESTSLRRQRIMPAEAIRVLPRGQALLLATGARVALLELQPWFRRSS